MKKQWKLKKESTMIQIDNSKVTLLGRRKNKKQKHRFKLSFVLTSSENLKFIL